jgi:cell division protein FtsA
MGIEDIILEPLASAEAVLTEEEKEIGVLVADIGGGTSTIAVIKDSSIYHTSVLPVAGNQITRDIEIGLGISFELAESLKNKYGSLVLQGETEGDSSIGEAGHSISQRDLCDIIRARVEELMHLIALEVPQNNRSKLIPAGIVLTGGSSNLPGIVELAQSVTRLPARIGVPPALVGVASSTLNEPAYATSVGLILWKMKNDRLMDQKDRQSRPAGIRGFFNRR